MTQIADLTAQDVLSVYSGVNGRCCCGCAGKHSFNSQYRAEGAKRRGYAVDDEDVNDRMIARVLNVLRKADPASVEVDDEYVSTVVGNRLYVAYLLK
jgi:hypothetical protein